MIRLYDGYNFPIRLAGLATEGFKKVRLHVDL